MYCGWGTQEYFCEGHDEDNKTFNDVFANEWCTGLDWIKRVSCFHCSGWSLALNLLKTRTLGLFCHKKRFVLSLDNSETVVTPSVGRG